MTTRAEMIVLARRVKERQQIVNELGMMNVANQTPEERVDLSAAYKVARDELMIAERAYQNALEGYVPPTPNAPLGR